MTQDMDSINNRGVKIMNSIICFLMGMFIGGMTGFILSTCLSASGDVNKEREAYEEGYINGINSVKNMEVE